MNLNANSVYNIYEIEESNGTRYYITNDESCFIHVVGYVNLEKLVVDINNIYTGKVSYTVTATGNLSVAQYLSRNIHINGKNSFKGKAVLIEENKTIEQLLDTYSYYLI